MKVLLIDNEDALVPVLQSKLQALGHELHHMPSRADAFNILENNQFDIVMVDPSPQTDLRQAVITLRRLTGRYTYIFLLGRDLDQIAGWQTGANDILPKPLAPDTILEKLDNAARLIGLVKQLGDEREDFPSAGGVIAKSAFNQLFLSGIERADRYGEECYVLFFTLSNHDVISFQHGKSVTEFASAAMAAELKRLRRQSDIMGQTGKYEYALILQRPNTAKEPQEAARRFVESLSKLQGITGAGQVDAEITVRLVALPHGAVQAEHTVLVAPRKVA
ncbi:MAG: diguanylate cyclase [Alphaproteobacteria bacterium]|nr:diguanylate cyclase [Alphaproteobacteria bacterium]